jgi:hypothetical protein
MHELPENRTTVSYKPQGFQKSKKMNPTRSHSRISKVYALVAARSKVYLSAATMILIVTLTVPAVAQITFDGAIQGHEKDTLQTANTQSSSGTATGIVSNLGQLSLTYQLTIDLMTGKGTGSGVLLIAKNGDSIFTTVTGQFHPVTPGSPLSVPSVTETYTITGGTGRFKAATGRFTVERLVDFVDVEMDFNFTGGVIVNGTITFPKAENAQ